MLFTVEQAVVQIADELSRLADPSRAEQGQRFFAQPVALLGIDTPTLRAQARAWLARLKPGWTWREASALCEGLCQRPYLEIRGFGFLVLGGFHREFEPALWVQAERWLERYLDNWALVDGFCSAVLSPLLRRHPELLQELPRWAASDRLWVRRAALVTLVPFARRGEHLGPSYALVEQSLAAPEDLMHKAAGWLLREAGKTSPPRLVAFLSRHRAAIPRTTVRYAIERFPAAERARLLALTRLAPRP